MVLPTPRDFDFLTAVCSHGFFVLAPNVWDPARRCLRTVVSVSDERAIAVTVNANAEGVSLRFAGKPSAGERAATAAAVRRMLRLDEDLSGFHERCRTSPTHALAADLRFGRLLRSASLFEDIVKVICTCNTSWRQTTAMVASLVANWGAPAQTVKGFPAPARLAATSVADLRAQGRLGYRAAFVHKLASDVAEGRLDLDAIERFSGPGDELYRLLRGIQGIGDYAAGHLLMLLGRYDRLAIDTELMRHLRDRFPRRRWTPATIRRHYAAWHPYQFLAYWFELWQGYADRHGRPEEWTADKTGRQITARS